MEFLLLQQGNRWCDREYLYQFFHLVRHPEKGRKNRHALAFFVIKHPRATTSEEEWLTWAHSLLFQTMVGWALGPV